MSSRPEKIAAARPTPFPSLSKRGCGSLNFRNMEIAAAPELRTDWAHWARLSCWQSIGRIARYELYGRIRWRRHRPKVRAVARSVLATKWTHAAGRRDAER